MTKKSGNLTLLIMNSIMLVCVLFGCENHSAKNIQKDKNKPNVIFIMADDMGIGDLSSYGAEMIKTPNIDRLATEGIKFDKYYTNGEAYGYSQNLIKRLL